MGDAGAGYVREAGAACVRTRDAGCLGDCLVAAVDSIDVQIIYMEPQVRVLRCFVEKYFFAVIDGGDARAGMLLRWMTLQDCRRVFNVLLRKFNICIGCGSFCASHSCS
jgi:hypothetical protein